MNSGISRTVNGIGWWIETWIKGLGWTGAGTIHATKDAAIKILDATPATPGVERRVYEALA